MTDAFDWYHAHAKINFKKVYVDSFCISVATENWHGLASVTIISAAWTGYLVLSAWNPRLDFLFLRRVVKQRLLYFLQYRNFWLLNGTHEEGTHIDRDGLKCSERKLFSLYGTR